MSPFPEKESLTVVERPEEFPEIPIEVENKSFVTPTPSQFKAKVTDDKGQPLVQPTGSQPISVQIPADQAQLATAVKGSVNDSLTWFAAFWVRIIKKAIHFGWQIVVGRRKQ